MPPLLVELWMWSWLMVVTVVFIAAVVVVLFVAAFVSGVPQEDSQLST